MALIVNFIAVVAFPVIAAILVVVAVTVVLLFSTNTFLTDHSNQKQNEYD